jgi:signal transduction histidine kinase
MPPTTDPAADEARYRHFFERAPVALFEEDFSRVRRWIDEQRALGVPDVRRRLESDRDAVVEAIRLIEIVDVNQAAVDLLGAPNREALLGTPTSPIITERAIPWFLEQVMAIADGRQSLRFDMVGERFSGDERAFTVTWVVGPGEAASDAPVVVAVVDTTDQKAREAELAALVEAKDVFLAAASHELRTPITSILGFADELAERWDHYTDPQRREFVGVIGAQAEQLARLVDDWLVVWQLQAQRLQPTPQIVHLDAVVREVLASRPLDEPRTVSAFLESAPALGNPTSVRQVVRHLLTNATRHGGTQIEVSTAVDVDASVIIVKDDGPGLSSDHIDDAFERYSSFANRYTLPGSLGIGLWVSRRLAELMNGALTYAHRDGWAEFRLELPRPLPDESAGPAPRS